MSICTPYEKVEWWLASYPRWKTRIETLKAQLQHIPGLTQSFDLVPIYGHGQLNESIINEVIRRTQIKEKELPLLELRVQLIDIGFSLLRPEQKIFVEMKYFEERSNPEMMAHFNCSPRSFYRKRREILEKMYDGIGGEDAEMWFELTQD